MKSIKFILNLALITSFLLFASCDNCKDVICQNEGVCDNGSCACDFLYEGAACELAIIENYLGDYAGTLTLDNNAGDSSSQNTSLSIQKDGQTADKLISVLGKFTLVEKDKFDIPFQQTDLITSDNVSTMEGSGSFSGNQIIINFTVKTGNAVIRGNFNGTK